MSIYSLVKGTDKIFYNDKNESTVVITFFDDDNERYVRSYNKESAREHWEQKVKQGFRRIRY